MANSNQNINIIVNAINKSKHAFKDVEKSFTKLQYKADQTRQKLEKFKPAFKKMALAGSVAFAGITAGIVSVTNKASDFEEATNKFNVVFKSVGNEADKMAKKLNDSYGLSMLKSKELLSATGDLLTGLGMEGKTALDLSGKVSKLAVDLASFTNAQGGAEAVSSALTKALLGERESLKTYGISIQEADVKAELLARGMDGLTGEAMRQARAEVTLAIAMRQSKNAIGDYERSTGSLAKSKKELKKTMEDLQVQLGQVFMPIMKDLLAIIQPAIEKFANWSKEHPKLVKWIAIGSLALAGLVAVLGTLGLVMTAILPVFTMLSLPILLIVAGIGLLIFIIVKLVQHWDMIKDGAMVLWESLVEIWNGILEFFSDILAQIMLKFSEWGDSINNGLNAVKEFFIAVFTAVKNIVTSYFNIYKTIIETVINAIKNIIGSLKNAFKSVFDWIVSSVIDPFMSKLEKVMNFVKKIINKMRDIGGNIASGVRGVFGRRASGGSVDPSKPYMVGEHGAEMFVPQSFGSIVPNNQLAGAGGGVNITITGNSFMGDDDMAEKVGDKIVRILKDNIRM